MEAHGRHDTWKTSEVDTSMSTNERLNLTGLYFYFKLFQNIPFIHNSNKRVFFLVSEKIFCNLRISRTCANNQVQRTLQIIVNKLRYITDN